MEKISELNFRRCLGVDRSKKHERRKALQAEGTAWAKARTEQPDGAAKPIV